jgi:hypothetical protein
MMQVEYHDGCGSMEPHGLHDMEDGRKCGGALTYAMVSNTPQEVKMHNPQNDYDEDGLRIESKEGHVVHEMKPHSISLDTEPGPGGGKIEKVDGQKFGSDNMETKEG